MAWVENIFPQTVVADVGYFAKPSEEKQENPGHSERKRKRNLGAESVKQTENKEPHSRGHRPSLAPVRAVEHHFPEP